jgi:hypothetical protein
MTPVIIAPEIAVKIAAGLQSSDSSRPTDAAIQELERMRRKGGIPER